MGLRILRSCSASRGAVKEKLLKQQWTRQPQTPQTKASSRDLDHPQLRRNCSLSSGGSSPHGSSLGMPPQFVTRGPHPVSPRGRNHAVEGWLWGPLQHAREPAPRRPQLVGSSPTSGENGFFGGLNQNSGSCLVKTHQIQLIKRTLQGGNNFYASTEKVPAGGVMQCAVHRCKQSNYKGTRKGSKRHSKSKFSNVVHVEARRILLETLSRSNSVNK